MPSIDTPSGPNCTLLTSKLCSLSRSLFLKKLLGHGKEIVERDENGFGFSDVLRMCNT